MKRIISIFLLLIMMVAGAHPVFAMHFCGGRLHSVDILDYSVSQSCCEVASSVPLREDDSCCANKQATSPSEDAHRGRISHEDCCDIQKIELSTDDYQPQTRQFNIFNILPPFESVWFSLSYLLNRIEADTTASIQQAFPPGGLDRQNIDLLTLICIYRI